MSFGVSFCTFFDTTAPYPLETPLITVPIRANVKNCSPTSCIVGVWNLVSPRPIFSSMPLATFPICSSPISSITPFQPIICIIFSTAFGGRLGFLATKAFKIPAFTSPFRAAFGIALNTPPVNSDPVSTSIPVKAFIVASGKDCPSSAKETSICPFPTVN